MLTAHKDKFRRLPPFSRCTMQTTRVDAGAIHSGRLGSRHCPEGRQHWASEGQQPLGIRQPMLGHGTRDVAVPGQRQAIEDAQVHIHVRACSSVATGTWPPRSFSQLFPIQHGGSSLVKFGSFSWCALQNMCTYHSSKHIIKMMVCVWALHCPCCTART